MNPDAFNTIDPNLDLELEEEDVIEIPDDYTMPRAVSAVTKIFIVVSVVAVATAVITSL